MRRQRKLFERQIQRLEQRADSPVHPQDLHRLPFRALEARQVVLFDIAGVGLEHFAEAVDQPRLGVGGPQRDGPVLLQQHPQPVGELAPTTALRTQGTASKAARVSCRSTVKKFPARCGVTLARSVTALLCVTSPCTVIAPIEKAGCRTIHQSPAATSATMQALNNTEAVMFISFTSKGWGTGCFMA